MTNRLFDLLLPPSQPHVIFALLLRPPLEMKEEIASYA